jgi:quinol monooxygenase YgiN
MTVISLLEFSIRPDALESAPGLISEILAATRAFSGSLGVEVIIDLDDANHFVLVERWDSVESDDSYRAWRATPEGASSLGSILVAPASLKRYSVANAI